MSYLVKSIFFTLQGEGAQAGRPAVFCRFGGCNLWSGRERDRASAICTFCDTDFVGTDGEGGGRFRTAQDLAAAIAAAWPAEGEVGGKGGRGGRGVKAAYDDATCPGRARRFVVCTGGEPLLQLDEPAIAAIHARGFEIAVETNGTRPAPPGIDWLTVSPKAGAPLVQTRGDELKLVYPQPGAMPQRFADLDFTHFFLQPMDGPNVKPNTDAAVQYCLTHPQWRLSIQMHKIVGIP